RAAFLPTGGPLLALVLLDPGPDADIAALAAMGVPMTVALDPMRAGVAQDARLWRDAGFEVAILAAALPSGATPADVEVALAAWRRMLPEAVAVIEPPEPVLQANRILAQQLVAVLTREGLGLATQEGKGLNAAAQLAAAAGVPQVAIWRVIDGEGDKAAAILRYLDRAAFEAQRGSGVAVMLHAWPETLAGLVEWHASRKTGPELAPFSALALTTQ
ncbi:divergent polysaccharide deacetylase family protein, partial [Phaeovulum sp.]|uniref:divergent polysaccharide deacetylase family protein n=1 Tax=Phaeovulum sp. TaxID=2934796 RepID=UPI00356B218C